MYANNSIKYLVTVSNDSNIKYMINLNQTCFTNKQLDIIYFSEPNFNTNKSLHIVSSISFYYLSFNIFICCLCFLLKEK
jgi:hypothetical protein